MNTENNYPSVETMRQWKEQIDADSSLVVFQDRQTAKYYSFRTVSEYVNGYFTDLKNGRLLEPFFLPVEGVRTIKGDTITSGAQLVTKARILTHTTLGSGDAANEATLLTLTYEDNAPAYLTNGRVRIDQNGELLRLRGGILCNKKAATKNEDDFVHFVPFVLKTDTKFQITFDLASAATAKHAYSFEYVAIEFFETTKG